MGKQTIAEGMTFTEIARKYGIAYATVVSRYQRGLRTLAELSAPVENKGIPAVARGPKACAHVFEPGEYKLPAGGWVTVCDISRKVRTAFCTVINGAEKYRVEIRRFACCETISFPAYAGGLYIIRATDRKGGARKG